MQVSLQNLVFLPPNSALSLLLAVWPLCRQQRDVQDYLVLLLRKAMFRCAGRGCAEVSDARSESVACILFSRRAGIGS